jgi:hypothetical protein
MRKHQFVKVKCECFKRATNFKCKYCGALEYKSVQEMRRLNKSQAECDHPEAPLVQAQDVFKGLIGGTFDCLAPDFETYAQSEKADS